MQPPGRFEKVEAPLMKLGINLGYWGAGAAGPSEPAQWGAQTVALAQEAERLGYCVAWAAEAYGSDAATVLTWVAAQTERIEVGSAVFQIPARTPAMTAMTAATLDALSGGRFRLGLGVSGPQVSEGWHGVRFDKPLARTREYVSIVRDAMARKTVRADGEFFTLPLPDGPGRALKLTVHPVRPRIPIYLAAVGPKNLELAGEIADGWLAIFLSPAFAAQSLAHIQTGRQRAGADMNRFDVAATVPVVVGDDVAACADVLRPYAALYVGGMGSREQNFYNDLAVRMGYAAEAAQVQDLFLDRDYARAEAAVPLAFIDDTSLIGPKERIADGMTAYAAAGVTTLNVSIMQSTAMPMEHRLAVLRTVAEAAELAGLAGGAL